MFELYKDGNDSSRPLLLIIIRSIGEKHPDNLADFFPQLCDASLFKPDSLNLRSGILCCVGGVNEVLFLSLKGIIHTFFKRVYYRVYSMAGIIPYKMFVNALLLACN